MRHYIPIELLSIKAFHGNLQMPKRHVYVCHDIIHTLNFRLKLNFLPLFHLNPMRSIIKCDKQWANAMHSECRFCQSILCPKWEQWFQAQYGSCWLLTVCLCVCIWIVFVFVFVVLSCSLSISACRIQFWTRCMMHSMHLLFLQQTIRNKWHHNARTHTKFGKKSWWTLLMRKG